MCTRPHFTRRDEKFCILLQDFEGNLHPKIELLLENWKREYPDLFPDSSPESAHEQEQVSDHSTIFVKVYLLNI